MDGHRCGGQFERRASSRSRVGTRPFDLLRGVRWRNLLDGAGERGHSLEHGGFRGRVGGAHQTISARLADAHVAAHLGIAVGSALLAVRRLIHDEDGRPVQWLHGLYRPDRYEYQMQLSRVGDIAARVWVSREMSAQFH